MDPRYYERRAAEILKEVFDGQVVWQDAAGAGPKTHDFDLHRPNGDVKAVEVTQVTNSDLKAFLSHKHNDKRIRSTNRLCKSWLILVNPSVFRFKQHTDNVEFLLSILEHLGVEKFGFRDPVPGKADDVVQKADDVVQKLQSLGVSTGFALCDHPVSNHPAIIIESEGETGVAHPEIVSSRVAREVEKADNLEKLGKAGGAKERHLFVWIDPLDFQAAVVMDAICENVVGFGMPATVNLPCEIEVVWVARQWSAAASDVCVLRLRKGGTWEKVR